METPITIKVFPERVPSYTGRTENASLVAFQDRDGAWVALTGTGGIYHATATGRRYGVAVGCGAPAAPAAPGITVYYQSVADTTEVLADGCRTEMETVRVLVEVQGLQASQTGEVSLGNTYSNALTTLTALIDHPRGPADLFVRSYTANGAQVDPVKLYRGPTLDLQADQSLQVDLDRLGLPPESHALTLTGLDPAETIIVDSSYTTPHSEMKSFPLWSPLGADAPDHYVTVDASQRQPDRHRGLSRATSA